MKNRPFRKKVLKTSLITLAVLSAAIWSLVLLDVFVINPRGQDEPGGVGDLPAVSHTDGGDTPTPEADTPPPSPDGTPSPAPSVSPSLPASPSPSVSPTPIQTPSPSPTNLPDPVATSKIIDINKAEPGLAKTLDDICADYNCAAVSLAFFNGGDTYHVYRYGFADISAQRPVDRGTKFRVASLSKLVTAICALYLSETGEIDLDGDISGYLGYDVRNPRFPDVPITPRMLMQHTSSLYDSEAFLASRNALSSTRTSTRDLLDAGSSFSRREPGTGHSYSNFGIAVLGAVCETVSGKLLDILAREVLFKPLGIDAAYTPANLEDKNNIAVIYDVNHRVNRSVQNQLSVVSSGEIGRDHHLAQGNLTISAIDYARILTMIHNGGTLDGVRVLSGKSVREIHKADVNAGIYMQGLAVRYKESSFLGENVYWHTGSAFGELTQFIYDYDAGRIAVVLTTGSDSGRDSIERVNVCTELTEAIWQHID